MSRRQSKQPGSSNTPINRTKAEVTFQHVEQLYSGPLPPTEEFQKYEDVCPGAADRIMKMAEAQSAHRQTVEKMIVQSERLNSLAGIVSAFVLCLASLFFGYTLVNAGYQVIGGIFGGVGLIGIVTAFIGGTKPQRK